MSRLSRLVLRAMILLLFTATAVPATAQQSDLSPQFIQFLAASPDDAAHLTILDQFVAQHPDDGNALAVRCAVERRVAMKAHQSVDSAINDCRKAVTIAPKSSIAHLTLADALYDSGDIAGSLPEYTTAIDLGETHFGIFWRRCDANRRTGNLDAALTDCNRQVELTPTDFPAVYARGVLHVYRKEYADAIVGLTAALAEKPDNVNALYWRGVAYLASGRPTDAEQAFTQCLALGDRSPDTNYYRAIARRALGKTQGAIDDLTEAMKRYQSAGMPDKASRMRDLLVRMQAATPSP